MRRFKGIVAALLFCFAALSASGQIVNRLGVEKNIFLRYAFGRMQQFNEDNLVLADSLYQVGVKKDNPHIRCLGLSLEYPVRFARGEYERMDECVREIKDELLPDKKGRDFLFTTLHEYCQYLINLGRGSDAMLEARAMERIAREEGLPVGRMYAYRIIGLIQSNRSNILQAIDNFTKAAAWCREARAEQELPNLYLLIAQEHIRNKDFAGASRYCDMAREYQAFFPSLKIKIDMTLAYMYYAEGHNDEFTAAYNALVTDPLYKMQTNLDDRLEMDIAYLRSRQLFGEALDKADSLSTPRARHDHKHPIYAELGAYGDAYRELGLLMSQKDSIYVEVQNEDLAILDAEMNNAALREEAQRLKARNQITILLGFLVMFAIAFFAILLSQWQLRQNLDEMRRKNNQNLAARRAFQKAMEAKEAENEYKVKILQNRTTNPLTGYEDFLNI